MRASIGYHTRLDSNNTVRVTGGSFGGGINQETVERLVNAHFQVKILSSGRGVFVDRQGREVSLYLSVDPLSTEAGQIAQKVDKTLKARLAFQASKCEHAMLRQDHFADCSSTFNCCSCGGVNCGCVYCFDCNACEHCRGEC